jgi:hypothetical protein
MSGTSSQNKSDGYQAWLAYNRVAPGERYDEYAAYSWRATFYCDWNLWQESLHRP